MDALKQQLLKVQQQLAGLTASQKMLTASLLVIMVMTLFFWSRFASVSDMEAVIDKPLTVEELANVKSAVTAQGIAYEVRDSRIYVPAARKAQVEKALSGLALDGKLPAAYSRAEDVEEKGPALESGTAREQRMQETRRRRVERIIRGWPGVTDAAVILTGERRVGFITQDRPTASVSITFTGGPRESKKIVDAARIQVAHVQSGTTANDVGITVNGQAYKPEDSANGMSSDAFIATRKDAEQHYVNNLLNQFSYIPDVKVNVSVKLETDSSVSTERLVDPKNKVEALRQQRTSSEENTQPANAAEPGVNANVGPPLESQAAAGTSSTIEKNETINDTAIGFRDKTTQSPGGNALPQSATISVPDAYYRGIWKAQNPKAANDPTPAELRPLITSIEASIREGTLRTLALTDEKAVSVATYYALPATPANVGPPDALAAIPTGTGFGAKEIALGALAVISLFMVSMMVKKSAPQPVLVGPPAAAPEPAMATGPGLLSVSELAGEVGEADLMMTGQELTEDAIEARQVIEQVGTMVKANPDVAANLVKRWLNQD